MAKGLKQQHLIQESACFHFSSQKSKYLEVLCQNTCFFWWSEKEGNIRLACRGYLITLSIGKYNVVVLYSKK